MSKQATIRAKAFSCESIRSYDILIEPDGAVLVWDSVAGYYTSCHILSASAIRRARKLAAGCPPPHGGQPPARNAF